MIDRELVRADAEQWGGYLSRHCLALLAELEQAEERIEQLSEWYNDEDRKTRELRARLEQAEGERALAAEGWARELQAVARLEGRLEQAERELSQEQTRGIDHDVYEMVCEERDALEARLAQVPALVEAHKRIIALPVPRAVEAIEISDQTLADWEQA